MRWYDDLYMGYKTLDDKESIIENIKNGNLLWDCYVISLPINDYDLLDIYPSYVLTQKRYLNSDIVIVGIAKGKEEALDMVQLVIMDCLEDTGGLKVKKYILDNMKPLEYKEESL